MTASRVHLSPCWRRGGFCRFCRCHVARKSQYSLGPDPPESRDKTVPIFVPTPRIEAFRAVASSTARTTRKSLKNSNLALRIAIIGNAAKLLILRGFLVRDQEVGGSNPLALANYLILIPAFPLPDRTLTKCRTGTDRAAIYYPCAAWDAPCSLRAPEPVAFPGGRGGPRRMAGVAHLAADGAGPQPRSGTLPRTAGAGRRSRRGGTGPHAGRLGSRPP